MKKQLNELLNHIERQIKQVYVSEGVELPLINTAIRDIRGLLYDVVILTKTDLEQMRPSSDFMEPLGDMGENRGFNKCLDKILGNETHYDR